MTRDCRLRLSLGPRAQRHGREGSRHGGAQRTSPGNRWATPPPRAAPGERGPDPKRGSCHSCCRGSRAAQPTVRPVLHPQRVRGLSSECAGWRRGGGAATPLSRRGRRPHRPDAPLAPRPRFTQAQAAQRPPVSTRRAGTPREARWPFFTLALLHLGHSVIREPQARDAEPEQLQEPGREPQQREYSSTLPPLQGLSLGVQKNITK